MNHSCSRSATPSGVSRPQRVNCGNDDTTKTHQLHLIPHISWWHHQMEAFSALLALCAGNSPVTSEFLSQRLVTRSFDIFCDLCLNKRLSNQSRSWWFETPSRSLWSHCIVLTTGLTHATTSGTARSSYLARVGPVVLTTMIYNTLVPPIIPRW